MRSESSTSFVIKGAKVPENKSSWEREFQGTKVPGSESSMYGKVCGNENSSYPSVKVQQITALQSISITNMLHHQLIP